MISPYLNKPTRTISEAVADMSAAAQAAADARLRNADSQLARRAVTFMLARFRDMRRSAGTAAQIAAYDREIRQLEAYLLRTSSEEAGA